MIFPKRINFWYPLIRFFRTFHYRRYSQSYLNTMLKILVAAYVCVQKISFPFEIPITNCYLFKTFFINNTLTGRVNKLLFFLWFSLSMFDNDDWKPKSMFYFCNCYYLYALICSRKRTECVPLLTNRLVHMRELKLPFNKVFITIVKVVFWVVFVLRVCVK